MTTLRAKLDEGRVLVGVLVTMPSPQLAQTLAATGIDWLLIDLEHGPIDLASAHAMIAATGGSDCAPLVRVPSTEPWLAKPALDAGAFGLVFPMISSRAQAEAAVRALRYPPAGERGFGPFYAPARWGLATGDYLARANDELLNVVLIEHIDALEELDDIVAVPGVDVALIAPLDLSTSLGVPGQRDHPKVQRAVAEAERKILAGGCVLGGLALTSEEANAKIERGYRLIVLGYDTALIQGTVGTLLAGLRR